MNIKLPVAIMLTIPFSLGIILLLMVWGTWKEILLNTPPVGVEKAAYKILRKLFTTLKNLLK